MSGAGRLRRLGPATLQDYAATTVEKEEKEKDLLERRYRSTRSILISCGAFSLLIAVVFAILAGLAYHYSTQFNSPLSIYVNQQMPVTPYGIHIGGSALPVGLTLPNDLTPYIGNIYRIWSISPQAHTLTIQGTGSTFDGVTTVATFGGAIGDGLMFEVLQANRIVLISVNGVTFS